MHFLKKVIPQVMGSRFLNLLILGHVIKDINNLPTYILEAIVMQH